MTPLLYLLGVLIFVFAIMASIGLHELGHMVPAKGFGVARRSTASRRSRWAAT